MVYKTNFVVVVKCNGKVLREKDEFVTLPFGSEYSLLLKNLDSRRSNVDISIDGQDVLNGSSLIIEPNNETEIKGFLKGNIAKNRFKFIKKTKEIQEHRGDKIDDGIIRVEFAFEKKPIISKQIIHEDHHHHYDHYLWYTQPWWDNRVFTYNASPKTGDDNKTGGDSQTFYSSCCDGQGQMRSCSAENLSMSESSAPQEDEGITVKGSEINQSFQNTWIGELDPSEVIILRLRGATDSGKEVDEPITVKTKLQCPTCGKKSSSNVKFCSNCGTFLE
jgi:hypothetical protein